jgi:branched-chain amino acid transport system permease protein
MLEAIVNGITDGAVFGLMALGLVLVYKATGVLNFAQGEIGTLSIYVAWVFGSAAGEQLRARLSFPGTNLGFNLIGIGLPILLAAMVAVVFAAGVGVVMERLVIRPMLDAPKVTVTVATLGVATVLGGLQFVIFGINPRVLEPLVGGTAFNVGTTFVSWGRILAILVTAGLGAALYLFFKRTLFGLGVLASAQNATSLRLTGMSLARVSMFTWASGGVIAALGGVILAPTIGAFHPFFMTLILIPSLAAALVGGMTSLPGAFVGGLLVGVLQSVVRHLWGSDVANIEIGASFALILAVLLFRPRGLLGAEA